MIEASIQEVIKKEGVSLAARRSIRCAARDNPDLSGPELAAKAIIHDLNCRRGIRHELAKIDPYVMEDIEKTFTSIIRITETKV